MSSYTPMKTNDVAEYHMRTHTILDGCFFLDRVYVALTLGNTTNVDLALTRKCTRKSPVFY